MYKNIFLLVVWIILILSVGTWLIAYLSIDPTTYPQFSLILMGSVFFLGFSSLLTIMLYWVKKIISRGQTSLYMIFSSLRQGILVSLFLLSIYAFDRSVFVYTENNLLVVSVIFLLGFIVLAIEAMFVKIQW